MDPLTLEGESRAKLRRKLVREALEEKNPAMFRALKRSGRLESSVRQREKELYQAYREEWNRQLDHHAQVKNAKDNPLEQAKEFEASLRQAWEEILATYLEF